MANKISLSKQDIRQFRAIGHHLKPVLILGDAGLSDAFIDELNSRLRDHELIKVSIHAEDRGDREILGTAMAEAVNASIVQRIGKMLLLYRAAERPNPKLSNILRYPQG